MSTYIFRLIRPPMYLIGYGNAQYTVARADVV